MIIGARNTTPIVSLQIEAFIPPLEIHRKYLAVKQYIKLWSDPNHISTKLCLNMGDMPPRGSYLSHVLDIMDTINLDNVRAYAGASKELPPWESIKRYIVASDLKLDNNIKLRDYIHDNYPNYL